MRKPVSVALLTVTSVVAAVSGLLGSNAAGASPPAHAVSGVAPQGAGPLKGGDGGGCQPGMDAYPNDRGQSGSDGNITVPRWGVVSINVVPHCVDGSTTVWALHHGWGGDPNYYIFPDTRGTYGPVSWGNRPFTYSGRPVGYRIEQNQQYTITFVAANSDCDGKLRALPHDSGYPGPDGQPPYGGPGPNGYQDGPHDPGYYDHPNAYRGDGDGSDGYGPGGQPGDGYGPGPAPGPGPNGYNGQYGFKDIPGCCQRLGDVNLTFDHWNN